MRIGISILTYPGHNLWNNGIGQNIYHLACLLERIPFVERVVLLNCGNQDEAPKDSGEIGARFPLIPLREAVDLVDIAIEMSGSLDPEWCRQFRARGGKIIFHACGQPYAALVDPVVSGKQSFFGEADRCDEVWLLLKDRPFAALMRGVHRCPVYEVPYLWAPIFLEDASKKARSEGVEFGYKHGSLSSGAIAAIFEPNISPIKMGVIPFMICEEVFRADKDAISFVHLLNTKHMIEQHSFVFLIEHSELYQNKRLALGERDYFSHVMARGANMVVSHQIDCPQNYLYFDAIAGGYPLVHNSPLFADVGYYYRDCDIQSGAEQFMFAQREHDRHFDAYTKRAGRLIAKHAPENAGNRDAYARRLVSLSQSNRQRRRA